MQIIEKLELNELKEKVNLICKEKNFEHKIKIKSIYEFEKNIENYTFIDTIRIKQAFSNIAYNMTNEDVKKSLKNYDVMYLRYVELPINHPITFAFLMSEKQFDFKNGPETGLEKVVDYFDGKSYLQSLMSLSSKITEVLKSYDEKNSDKYYTEIAKDITGTSVTLTKNAVGLVIPDKLKFTADLVHTIFTAVSTAESAGAIIHKALLEKLKDLCDPTQIANYLLSLIITVATGGTIPQDIVGFAVDQGVEIFKSSYSLISSEISKQTKNQKKPFFYDVRC